jgi:hypothetical protein
VIGFAYSKVEAVEQALECVAPDLIREVHPVPTLQRVRLKKATVQKRNVSKAPCCAASQGSGLIQGSEKEWAKEVAMDLPPTCKAPIDLLGQKTFTSCKPSLALDEVQKQHPGELK